MTSYQITLHMEFQYFEPGSNSWLPVGSELLRWRRSGQGVQGGGITGWNQVINVNDGEVDFVITVTPEVTDGYYSWMILDNRDSKLICEVKFNVT